MLKSNFSVCPICGNIIHTKGENINSCYGINLTILEARFTKKGNGIVYAYCNKDGLIKKYV